MFALLRRRARLMRQYMLGMKGLRSDDVLLASYPRSGSTWLRFILFHYIGLVEEGGWDADFHKLDDKMVALGRSDLRKPWPHDALPRFVKTHQPYRMLLFARVERAVCLVRDARDVMVSYHAFLSRRTEQPFTGTLDDFVRDPDYGIDRWCDHYLSWERASTRYIAYEDLRTAPESTVRLMLEWLDVPPRAEALTEAIRRASVHRIREAQEKSGFVGEERFAADFVFAREARVGGWRNQMEPSTAAFCQQRAHTYGIDIDQIGRSRVRIT